MNIGKRIKRKREELGISQRELARRIEMSGQMISKIEAGLSTPSIETINKISSIFNVPITYFLEDSTEESFTYKLICAIEKSYKDKYDTSAIKDIFQVLSNDLDINYEDFDNFQIKKTVCTKSTHGSYVFNQIENDNFNKKNNFPIDLIEKLLNYYNALDNYEFEKFCLEANNNFDINAEIKKIINEMLPEFQTEEQKNLNINQYYRYLELRILELAASSDISISKSTRKKIVSDIDSFVEFQIYKLKNNWAENRK